MRAATANLSIIALAALVWSMAAPALASPKTEPEGHGGAQGDEMDEKEIARSIELGGLVFPVFDKNHKLQNYIFVNARMVVAPNKDTWKYREKAHFIRDAVIRASHKVSFAEKNNSSRLDEKLAAAECLKAAHAALGEQGVLASMTFTQIDSQNKDGG